MRKAMKKYLFIGELLAVSSILAGEEIVVNGT